METLLTPSSEVIVAPSSAAKGCNTASVAGNSSAGTVNPMAVRPSLPTFWAIISTTMFRSAMAEKT